MMGASAFSGFGVTGKQSCGTGSLASLKEISWIEGEND